MLDESKVPFMTFYILRDFFNHNSGASKKEAEAWLASEAKSGVANLARKQEIGKALAQHLDYMERTTHVIYFVEIEVCKKLMKIWPPPKIGWMTSWLRRFRWW